MLDPQQFIALALAAGCPPDQVRNLVIAGILLQERQLVASAAARLCDKPDGPAAIGYGGARGGGKSHWLLAQVGADDCQRYPGLKCVLLRKSGKANRESFGDLCQKLFPHLKHSYSPTTGILLFENGSRILIKHYQHEKEINESFLGMEYDVIAIEEATTLTLRKWLDIQTCCRTSKPGWRPRIYLTANPGGVGHDWFRNAFVVPCDNRAETKTRFIPARVQDNLFINPDYKKILEAQTGWRQRAWCEGKWDMASGQFFNTFRYDVHVLKSFDENLGVEWLAAMDYGFTHHTVVLLGCLDAAGNLTIVDEYVARLLGPQRLASGIHDMFFRHKVQAGLIARPPGSFPLSARDLKIWPDHYTHRRLSHFVAGGDLFSRQFDGSTLASHFSSLGHIRPANTNRVYGWAEIQHRFGDPDAGVKPTLFIHERCQRLLECLPYLQNDPDHPADILKTNINEEGLGGDDAADALRYMVATKHPRVYQRKLLGL